MKKLIVLLLSIMMAVTLTACGKAHTSGGWTSSDVSGQETKDDSSEDIDTAFDPEAEKLEIASEQGKLEDLDDFAVMQKDSDDSDSSIDEREEAENRYGPADIQEEAKSEESTDGIRPEFKEAMDVYEAFFDEYAEFMKKYRSTENSFSLLTDYMMIMSRYAEVMESLDEIDEDNLSTEEYLYYVEVMTRINAKLLEAAD